jgi:hypothetical protein
MRANFRSSRGEDKGSGLSPARAKADFGFIAVEVCSGVRLRPFLALKQPMTALTPGLRPFLALMQPMTAPTPGLRPFLALKRPMTAPSTS